VTNYVSSQRRVPRRVHTAAVARPSVLAVRIGLAGIVCSLLFMTRLTVAAWDKMSVLDTTMSDYVYVPTFGWMFGASVLCIGIAGIGATAGLAAIRLLNGVLLKLAMALAVLGSVLAAIFRTDLGESLSTSAQIHRYAAGVVFFCVPIAVFLVARGLSGVGYLARDRKLLYANVIVTSIVLTLFMTSHFGAMPEVLQDLNGVFQRVLFVLELSLLGQLTLLPLRFRPASQEIRDESAHVVGVVALPKVPALQVGELPDVRWQVIGHQAAAESDHDGYHRDVVRQRNSDLDAYPVVGGVQ
jgi:hypothetical protein